MKSSIMANTIYAQITPKQHGGFQICNNSKDEKDCSRNLAHQLHRNLFSEFVADENCRGIGNHEAERRAADHPESFCRITRSKRNGGYLR